MSKKKISLTEFKNIDKDTLNKARANAKSVVISLEELAKVLSEHITVEQVGNALIAIANLYCKGIKTTNNDTGTMFLIDSLLDSIDRSSINYLNTCTTNKKSGESGGRPSIIDSLTDEEKAKLDINYEAIAGIYPKGRNPKKEDARKAFYMLNPTTEEVVEILKEIEESKNTEQWQDVNYVPYLHNFFERKRQEKKKGL